MGIRSVPKFKNTFVSSMQNPGPRLPNQYEPHVLQMPRKIGVDVHLRWCPSISNGIVRSSRSVLPKKKNGCNTSSSTIYCFSRAALNLLVFFNQSAPIHVENNIPFGSSQQCSPGRVKTRPELKNVLKTHISKLGAVIRSCVLRGV